MVSRWLKLNMFFIAKAQLRKISLPAVAQLNIRRVYVNYVVEQVVLLKVSSGSFLFPLSVLFHHCSTSIYSFIYHWQYIKAATASVVNKIRHTYPIFTTANLGAGVVLFANVTANRKVSRSSVVINCARQNSGVWAWLAAIGRRASDSLSTYTLHIGSQATTVFLNALRIAYRRKTTLGAIFRHVGEE